MEKTSVFAQRDLKADSERWWNKPCSLECIIGQALLIIPELLILRTPPSHPFLLPDSFHFSSFSSTHLHLPLDTPSLGQLLPLRRCCHCDGPYTNSGFSHRGCEMKQPPCPWMISVLSSCNAYLPSHSTRSHFHGRSGEFRFTICTRKKPKEGNRKEKKKAEDMKNRKKL